jgi:hypothetical protein
MTAPGGRLGAARPELTLTAALAITTRFEAEQKRRARVSWLLRFLSIALRAAYAYGRSAGLRAWDPPPDP